MPKEEDARFKTGSESAPVESKPKMDTDIRYGESFTDYFIRMYKQKQDISNEHPAAHDAKSRGSSISSNSPGFAETINPASLTDAPTPGGGKIRTSEPPPALDSPRTPIRKLGAHKRKAGNEHQENDMPAPKRMSRGETLRLIAEGHPLLQPFVERRFPLQVATGKYREEPSGSKAEKHLHGKHDPSVIGAVSQKPTGLIRNDPAFRHSPNLPKNTRLVKRGDVGAIAKGDPVAETIKENYDRTSRRNGQQLNTRPGNDGHGID